MIAATWFHADAMALVHGAAFGTAGWSASSIATLLENPTSFGFLDEDGGMILARAVAGEAEILTIGVIPAQRRKGLGRAMLAEAMDAARRRGAETMFLDVEAGNHAAIALYRAAGFAGTGRRRNYYGAGLDALLLSRRLCGSPE